MTSRKVKYGTVWYAYDEPRGKVRYGIVEYGMVQIGKLVTSGKVTASLPLNTPLASASPTPHSTAAKAAFEK